MKQLFFSPLSENIYFGNGVPSKKNPKVITIRGEKIDVTQSFYDVLFQKCPPGNKITVNVNGGETVLEVSVKEAKP
jgi:hypothetical protein